MRHTFVLSSLRLSDAPIAAGIHQACFADYWQEEAFKRFFSQAPVCGWLLRVSTRPTGFIMAQIIAEEAEILTFGVIPSAQHHGWGELLLKKLLQHLAKNKVKALFLEVSVLNVPALKLYQKLGFQAVGQRRNYFMHLPESAAEVLKYHFD